MRRIRGCASHAVHRPIRSRTVAVVRFPSLHLPSSFRSLPSEMCDQATACPNEVQSEVGYVAISAQPPTTDRHTYCRTSTTVRPIHGDCADVPEAPRHIFSERRAEAPQLESAQGRRRRLHPPAPAAAAAGRNLRRGQQRGAGPGRYLSGPSANVATTGDGASSIHPKQTAGGSSPP
jgi:hypothetical protein